MSSPKSKVELLSNLYPMKNRLSTTILILSIFVFIFLLLSPVVTIIDLLTIHERVLINAVVLILSILLFIAIFWRENRGDFFSFINIILWLYFPFFVIPIFTFLFLPEVNIRSDYWDMSSFEYAVWIVIFSLYALCFGYKLAQKIGINISLPFGTEPSIRRIVSYVFISIIALLVIAIIKSHLMHASLSEIIGFKSYGSELTKMGGSIGGHYTVLLFFESFFSYIFFTCFMLPKDNPKNKALIRCANIFILLYIAYTITNGIISTSKTAVIFIPFFLIAFLHYTRRKVSFKELFILLFISIFILITFNSLRTSQAIFHLNFSNAVGQYLQSFTPFENLCMVISHFSNNDYYFGQRLFVDTFSLLIPRALWIEKPFVYGIGAPLYDINHDFFFSGYAAGLPGQFYADFGLPGVIIGFAVFGALIRIVYNIFRKNSYNTGVVILYIIIISQSQFFLHGGFPWLIVLVMTILPFSTVLYYIYPHRKKLTL